MQLPDPKMYGLKSGQRLDKAAFDPDDGDYKETIKKNEKKAGSFYGAPMLCKK